jgi:hypothetical protein
MKIFFDSFNFIGEKFKFAEVKRDENLNSILNI